MATSRAKSSAKPKPRAKKQVQDQKGPSREELAYLAGLFVSNLQGLKNVNVKSAIAINKKPDWTQYMAKTFGGTSDEFVSEKSGKRWFGWFLPVKERLNLVRLIEAAGVAHGTDATEFDGIKTKLERAIPLEERED